MKFTHWPSLNITQFNRPDTTVWLYCKIFINLKTFFSIYSKMNTMKWQNPIWMWNFCVWIRQYCYRQPEHHWLGSVLPGVCRVERLKKPDEPFEFIFYFDDSAKKWTMKRKQSYRLLTSVHASMWTIFWIWVSVFWDWVDLNFLSIFLKFYFQFTDNSDLIACTVLLKDGTKYRRFLVIEALQLVLVEPDSKRLGWGSKFFF